MKKDFQLITSRKNLMRISTYSVSNPAENPCVFLVHGFKGFKDWGYGPYLCKFLAQNVFFSVGFNFSHNGVGEDLLNFTELDEFADNTISLEIEELNEVIEFYKNGGFGFLPQNPKIGIIGHSRGGAVSIVHCAEKKNLDALVLWASVSYLDRYSERQKEEWIEKGFFEVLNTRTNQLMRLNRVLLDDIIENKARFDLKKRIAEISAPILIVHGDQDLAVPVKEAYELYQSSKNENTELFIVEKAGHTFDIVHPFQGSNEKFDSVVDRTLDFLNRNLTLESL
ncbi:MAG: prolyl oligopeptidase family serine peptidase [Bacteroidetes bacterium]|nr:prolyl oligopeptidase family serine peptidase [Bacteroidota bacterium]MBU2583738.1 prolyl oligopeptidase family serine peptidase [Bacteroidota bacterium]